MDYDEEEVVTLEEDAVYSRFVDLMAEAIYITFGDADWDTPMVAITGSEELAKRHVVSIVNSLVNGGVIPYSSVKSIAYDVEFSLPYDNLSDLKTLLEMYLLSDDYNEIALYNESFYGESYSGRQHEDGVDVWDVVDGVPVLIPGDNDNHELDDMYRQYYPDFQDCSKETKPVYGSSNVKGVKKPQVDKDLVEMLKNISNPLVNIAAMLGRTQDSNIESLIEEETNV
jgi:hypothetical protein